MAIKPTTSGYRVRVGQYGTARSFPTKKLAEKYEREEKQRNAEARSGLDPERSPMRYDELCELYLANRGGNTAWLESMLVYSRRQFGRTYVHMIRPEEVGRWLAELKREKGIHKGAPLAPKTKQHILDAMRQVISQGVEWGYPRKSPVRPRAVKVKDGNAASSRIDPFESWAEVQQVASQTRSARDEALVLFIAATGLRPEEALALRWNRLDLKDGTGNVLTVVESGREHDAGKTPGALRPFILPRRALDALSLLPQPLRRSQLVFQNTKGGFVNLDNWRRRVWKDAMLATGLRWRPLYQLRHTFATLALEQGVPLELIGEQLGHTDIRTTRKHYAKYRKASAERMRSILDSNVPESDAEDTISNEPVVEQRKEQA